MTEETREKIKSHALQCHEVALIDLDVAIILEMLKNGADFEGAIDEYVGLNYNDDQEDDPDFYGPEEE